MTDKAARKIIVERDHLDTALTHVKEVVATRRTIPILGNVKLTAANGELCIMGTDMDTCITHTLACDGPETDFATTLPATILSAIVNQLPSGGEVSLAIENENEMMLECGKVLARIPTLPASDFPDMEDIKESVSFTLPAKELETMLEKTAFAISQEEARYYLRGIFLHVADDKLVGVATDGHKLSKYQLDGLPQGCENMPGVIVPRIAVSAFIKLAKATEKEITIDVSEVKIRVKAGQISVLSKVIDGNFPDYLRAIPQNSENSFLFDAVPMARAARIVAAVQSNRGHTIKIQTEDQCIQISSVDSNGLTASNEEPCVIQSGKAGQGFGCNGSYLQEILQVNGDDEIIMYLGDPGVPIKFISKTHDHTMVLMPVRF